jgi:hypothetical protein
LNQAEVISRFEAIYLGDSLLEVIELRTADAECRLTFNAGKVLKADGSSIFEPEATFEPACLALLGVRSLHCEGGPYQLNATVVGFGAEPGSVPGFIEFYLDLTGGIDPAAFMVRMTFLATHFEFGPAKQT